MKNILVTGGAGFIGSNFIRHILRCDPEVCIVNLDALTYAGNLDNLADLPTRNRYTMVAGDICNSKLLRRIMRKSPIDAIVHFAAETHVDRSIIGPEQFMQTNVMGTFALLELARTHNIRFHHVSTDEVYGSLGPSEAPWDEQAPYAPNSPYSASKAASDHLVRSYGHTYGLPFTITNCSNNYGPRQHPEKLIPMTITNTLDSKPTPVYGNGEQIRDWIYVEDHCEAIRLVLEKGKIGETYNVGGDNQPINIEIICMIHDILGKGSIEHVKDRPGHDCRYAIDSSKIYRELGWEPKKSLRDGLEETVKWYKERVDK